MTRAFVLTTTLVLACAGNLSAQNRLPPIPAEKQTEAQKVAVAEHTEVRPDGCCGPGVWSVYLRIPEIMTPLRQLHEQAHLYPRLSQKLIHFAILITARRWTNSIWSAHDEDAVKEGVKPETVQAIADGKRPPQMPEDEEIVFDFSTELLEKGRVSDKTYARALARFGEEGVVQVAAIHGLYTYLSLVTNTALGDSTPPGALKPLAR